MALKPVFLVVLCVLTVTSVVSGQTCERNSAFCGCCSWCKASPQPTWDGPTDVCDCTKVAACTNCTSTGVSCGGSHERGCSGDPNYDAQCACASGYKARDGGCHKKSNNDLILIIIILAIVLLLLLLCCCGYRYYLVRIKNRSNTATSGDGQYEPPPPTASPVTPRTPGTVVASPGDTAALLPGPTAMSGRSFGSFDESPVKAAATPDGAAPPASRRSRQTDSTSLLQDATAETDVSVVMVEEDKEEASSGPVVDTSSPEGRAAMLDPSPPPPPPPPSVPAPAPASPDATAGEEGYDPDDGLVAPDLEADSQHDGRDEFVDDDTLTASVNDVLSRMSDDEEPDGAPGVNPELDSMMELMVTPASLLPDSPSSEAQQAARRAQARFRWRKAGAGVRAMTKLRAAAAKAVSSPTSTDSTMLSPASGISSVDEGSSAGAGAGSGASGEGASDDALYSSGIVAFMKHHLPFMPKAIHTRSGSAIPRPRVRLHAEEGEGGEEGAAPEDPSQDTAPADTDTQPSEVVGAGDGDGAGAPTAVGDDAGGEGKDGDEEGPPMDAMHWLEGLGPIHLLWGVFHHFASTGDPTRSSSMTSLQWRKFCRESRVLAPRGKRRRHSMNGAAVDLVFTKKTSSKSEGVGKATLRATHEELRSYADTGRRGAMSFEAFHSAVRAVSRHMYPPPADSFATFFEKHIVPVALDEGDKLLAMSDRRLVKGYSANMNILQELEQLHRPEMQRIFRVNNASLSTIYNAYCQPGSGMKYAGLLTFCHDFVLVPRRCDMTQLLDVFMAVNVGDGADDLVDVLSFDEFVNFLAVFAMRHTPPKASLSPVRADVKPSPVRSVQQLFQEMDAGGGKDKLTASTRGVGKLPPFVGASKSRRGT